MCKESYTVEDFVLDPEFQKWVLHPNKESNCYWDKFLTEHPQFRENIITARKLVINMAKKTVVVSDEQLEDTWELINKKAKEVSIREGNEKVVPLNAETTIFRHSKVMHHPGKGWANHQFYKLLAILLLTFGLAICANLFFPSNLPQEVEPEAAVVFENHIAPPGVKSSFTLADGSKVMLNAGSSLRYIKGFESHQRVLELEGEAFFDVAKSPNRPFMVKSEGVTTTALGTSFNIKAYRGGTMDIALVSGQVQVSIPLEENHLVSLQQGQGIRVNMSKKSVSKFEFDEDVLLAWTRKTIVFRQTPINEIKSTLENWFGVKITYVNRPENDLEISGRFTDQTLENVLKGLSHSARFDFRIVDDQVFLTFN
ncbi:FecR family protein [Pleomorphovibrio marinus]|uniref:FecR family protein n=1 Tax=Pleomorphovibrio marinus TaxID=2164132 RepID=UPI000E0A71BE|nr:FecR domain-containing protein [Pleomorphovibrio marinus]